MRAMEEFHNHKDVALLFSAEAAGVLEHFQWKSPPEVQQHGEDGKDELSD